MTVRRSPAENYGRVAARKNVARAAALFGTDKYKSRDIQSLAKVVEPRDVSERVVFPRVSAENVTMSQVIDAPLKVG